jgi:NADH-quinone oxidoreductase subunit L
MAEVAHKLNDFLAPIFAASHEHMKAHEVSHNTEWMLTGISTVLIIVVVFAWSKFSKKPDLEEASGVGKVLQNKWYVDEIYDRIIVRPLAWFGSFLNNFIERSVVDGLVNGVGRLVNYSSRQLRLLQSGQVGSYVLLMVLGMLIIFVVQFFLRKN